MRYRNHHKKAPLIFANTNGLIYVKRKLNRLNRKSEPRFSGQKELFIGFKKSSKTLPPVKPIALKEKR